MQCYGSVLLFHGINVQEGEVWRRQGSLCESWQCSRGADEELVKESGLALKNPPKKTHPKKPKKTHLKKPTKSGFFWVFLGFFKFLIFYESNKNFSLSN
jgi:hypothetical protein